jgi:hypothetical protein
VRPQERACPGVARRHAEHGGPVHARDENRVARPAVTGGDPLCL